MVFFDGRFDIRDLAARQDVDVLVYTFQGTDDVGIGVSSDQADAQVFCIPSSEMGGFIIIVIECFRDLFYVVVVAFFEIFFNDIPRSQHVVDQSTDCGQPQEEGGGSGSPGRSPAEILDIFRIDQNQFFVSVFIGIAGIQEEGSRPSGGDDTGLLLDDVIDKIVDKLCVHITGIGDIRTVGQAASEQIHGIDGIGPGEFRNDPGPFDGGTVFFEVMDQENRFPFSGHAVADISESPVIDLLFLRIQKGFGDSDLVDGLIDG